MSIELKTASGGSVTLVPEDGVSNVTATVKHESGVLASEFDAGVGRTWQDVTASRSAGVTYTNNTGRDIFFIVTAQLGDVEQTLMQVNGNLVAQSRGSSSSSTSDPRYSISVIIPDGSTYSYTLVGGTLRHVWELR